MPRTHHALTAMAIALVATSVPAASQPADLDGLAARIEELSASGLGEEAPTEIELAHTLLQSALAGEQGAADLASAQVRLLEALDETRRLEVEAIVAEKKALEAEMEMRTEKASYEFVVEQILSSGVAAFWSVP